MKTEKNFNILYFLIGLIFRWVGLILFFCFRKEEDANSFLYGFACRYILGFIIIIFFIIISIILEFNSNKPEEYVDRCESQCVGGYYDYGDKTCICPYDSEFKIDDFDFHFPDVETY